MRGLKKLIALGVAVAGSLLAGTARADFSPFGGASTPILTFTDSTTAGSLTLSVTVKSAAYAPLSFPGATYLPGAGGNELYGADPSITLVPNSNLTWVYLYQISNNSPPSNDTLDHFSFGIPAGFVTSMGFLLPPGPTSPVVADPAGDGVAPAIADGSTGTAKWDWSGTGGHAVVLPGQETAVLILTSFSPPAQESALEADNGVAVQSATHTTDLVWVPNNPDVVVPMPRASLGLVGLMVLLGGIRFAKSRRALVN